MPRYFEHVVMLYPIPTQRLARCGNSPLDPRSLWPRWTPKSYLQSLLLSIRSNGLLMRLLHHARRVFRGALSSPRPCQPGCGRRAAIFWLRLRAESFFSFLFVRFPHCDVSFRLCVEFLVLCSTLFIAFMHRCGTSWGKSAVRLKFQATCASQIVLYRSLDVIGRHGSSNLSTRFISRLYVNDSLGYTTVLLLRRPSCLLDL